MSTIPEKITNLPKAPKPKLAKTAKFPKPPKHSPAPGPARPLRDGRTHSPRYWGSDTDGWSEADGEEGEAGGLSKGKNRAASPTGLPGAPGYNAQGRRIHRKAASVAGAGAGAGVAGSAGAGTSVAAVADQPWLNQNHDLMAEYNEYDDDDDEGEPAEAEVPYGGILSGVEAEVGDRRPTNGDRKRWERAKDVVEVSACSHILAFTCFVSVLTFLPPHRLERTQS